MNSDEIRKRAKEIAENIVIEATEAEILKLAEDIRGKPLEPEFDESLVKHGSVWGNYDSTAVVIQSTDGFTAVCLKAGCIYEPGSHWPGWGTSKKDIIEHIKSCQFKYLGQFDFSYPQKHPLFDEAVELLKAWRESHYRGVAPYPHSSTQAFLTKLGGK